METKVRSVLQIIGVLLWKFDGVDYDVRIVLDFLAFPIARIVTTRMLVLRWAKELGEAGYEEMACVLTADVFSHLQILFSELNATLHITPPDSPAATHQ